MAFGVSACLIGAAAVSFFACSESTGSASVLLRGLSMAILLRFLSIVMIIVSICTIEVGYTCSKETMKCYSASSEDAFEERKGAWCCANARSCREYSTGGSQCDVVYTYIMRRDGTSTAEYCYRGFADDDHCDHILDR